MICGLCSVISQEKWWVKDQSKKALSLPLNLSHGKDKGFSLCFCFLSKALTPLYDKLILQFNLRLEPLDAEKQAGSKCMKSKQRVQETTRMAVCSVWARERQEGRQVPWSSRSQAVRQANKFKGRQYHCRQKVSINVLCTSIRSRLSSAKSGKTEKCGSVRGLVCWAVDWIIYCW